MRNTAFVLMLLTTTPCLAQTSAPAAPAAPSSPAPTQSAPGAPPSGAPALSPKPGTPSPGGVTQTPAPALNSTPSQTNVDTFPPSRLTAPGGPAAPGATRSDQITPPSQVPATPGAQTSPSNGRPSPGGANSTAGGTPKKTGNDYNLDECLGIWDAQTHMSKAEWRAACKRVQNRLENLDALATANQQKRTARKQWRGALE